MMEEITASNEASIPEAVRDDEDHMWIAWQQRCAEIYDQVYYDSNPVVAYINRYGHKRMEKEFDDRDHFGKVLEIGAGSGEHLNHVRHSFDAYYVTDLHADMLRTAERRHQHRPNLIFEVQNALELKFPDRFFDRLISVYNLEHLPNPHLALKEWKRVVKKGGILSIAIPTEGGLFWNTGRFFSTRRSFKKLGLNLDYIIAREHINACYRLRYLINYYFPEKKEAWFPCFVPTTHLNLIYTCTIKNL